MKRAPLGIARTMIKGDRLLVDVPTLLNVLRLTFPERNAYDASFVLPDGRHLLAELEHAPSAEISVDPANLPDWIHFWEGPS